VSIVLVLLTLVRLLLSWRQQLLTGIPRPKGAPFLGNVHQISATKPHFTFTTWARELGEIYCVRMFGRNLVVLNGSASIREALIERGQELAGRPRRFRIGCITNDFRNIGFCNPSRAWWILRQTVHRELKMTGEGLQKLEDITLGIIGETKRELVELSSGGPDLIEGKSRIVGGERAIDIRPALYGATMSIMCAFLVGEKYDKSGEEFLMFREMERLGITLLSSAGEGAFLDALPWLRYLGNSTYRRLNKFSSLRDKLYDRLREKSLKGMDDNTGNAGVLQALLRSVKHPELQHRVKSPYDLPLTSSGTADDSSDEVFTEEHIKGTFVDIILAGTASTSNLVYAFLNIMLHYPDVYEMIKTEINDKLNERSAEDSSHPITLADRGSMPYMQAAILELLRYVSIAPFSVPHLALVDTMVGGHDIPRGTEVLCNLWALHHDEANWEEPWEFRPDRFLDTNGTAVVSADHPRRKHMLPFSAGPRRCTGEVFAMSRLFLLLASLLKDFDLYPPVDAELVSCDPRTYALGIAFYPLDFNIVLKPTKFLTRTTDGL